MLDNVKPDSRHNYVRIWISLFNLFLNCITYGSFSLLDILFSYTLNASKLLDRIVNLAWTKESKRIRRQKMNKNPNHTIYSQSKYNMTK
jgi:hypothetical protein